MAPFSASEARLSASVDKMFGELFTFSARKVAATDVDLPKIADATRPDFITTGVFEAPTKAVLPNARGSVADDNAHTWESSMPCVSIADSTLAWLPRQGDRVTRQADGATYEVARTMPDAVSRTMIFLTSRKG